MAMGMGVDQAGVHQQAGRVEDRRALGRREAGAHGMDHAVLDQHVGRLAAAAGGVRQQRATDQEEAFFRYRHRVPRTEKEGILQALCVGQATGRSTPLDHGNSTRSAIETAWNSTIPIAASSTTAPKAKGVRKKAIEVWMR